MFRSAAGLRRLLFAVLLSAVGLAAAGCGQQYVVLHPAGPVAAGEFGLMKTVMIAMGVVIAFVFTLFAITLVRFRERPGPNPHYNPRWSGNRRLELLLFIIPVLIIAFIAVPTVQQTYSLDRIPPQKRPIIINVTSLTWKWLFEYPGQHIATVNRVEIPAGVPVLFRLTADSALNTFWVPRLGGMEYTVPGRVLPLWLEAKKTGVYDGRSGQFSGRDFVDMTFKVDAVSPAAFRAWAASTRRTAPRLSNARYKELLAFGTAGEAAYSSFPSDTFPKSTSGFTVVNGRYRSAS